MFFGPPAVAGLLGADETTIGISAFTGWLMVLIGWMIFVQTEWSKCWRCGEPLSRGPHGWHAPLVLWTRCPTCGVRHAATPDEVHANPMAHLKPGKRWPFGVSAAPARAQRCALRLAREVRIYGPARTPSAVLATLNGFYV